MNYINIYFLQGSNEEYLFDPQLLKSLNWNSVLNNLNPPITNENPGEPWLVVRPLCISDYNKGYVQILSQLTSVGNVSKADFEGNFLNVLICIFYVKRVISVSIFIATTNLNYYYN